MVNTRTLGKTVRKKLELTELWYSTWVTCSPPDTHTLPEAVTLSLSPSHSRISSNTTRTQRYFLLLRSKFISFLFCKTLISILTKPKVRRFIQTHFFSSNSSRAWIRSLFFLIFWIRSKPRFPCNFSINHRYIHRFPTPFISSMHYYYYLFSFLLGEKCFQKYYLNFMHPLFD